jgi:hypothetical protein
MATAGPAHRVQSAVEVYGYPQGHLGHLTEEEEAALKNFKLVCAEKGLYTPGKTEEETGSVDDATLLYAGCIPRAKKMLTMAVASSEHVALLPQTPLCNSKIRRSGARQMS